MIRADGAPGDSDRYPRWNIVARREGARAGRLRAFQLATTTWSRSATAGRVDPFGGEVRDGRVYGRGACDMKGGLAASIIAAEAFLAVCPDFAGAIEISATADEESGGYGGVAYLAEQGYFAPARVQHVIIPEPLNKDRICLGHRGVWWAEIETQGPDRPRLHAVPGRLRRPPHGRGPGGDGGDALPAAGHQAHRDAGGARRRAAIDAEHQLHPRRRAGAGRRITPAFPRLRARPLPHHHRPALPDRGGPGRGQGARSPR